MKTNKDKLPLQLYTGRIHHPTNRGTYRVNAIDGKGIILPGVGGITFNYQLKDNCMNIIGDHIEPGVSIKNPLESENNALNLFSCMGNKAVVVNNPEIKGYVVGTHGGVEHVMIYFKKEDLYKLNNDDKINVYGIGTGLKVEGFENVTIMNIDPELFEKMVTINKDTNKLRIKVTKILPSYLLGSGIGSETAQNGDYDIMTHDKESYKKYHLDELRFGDFILIKDHDNIYGRRYIKNYITIGVIVHSDSFSAGHGPGVMTFITGDKKYFDIIEDKEENLLNYLK